MNKNERMTILIAVKDRWIETDQVDEFGMPVRLVNQNPTVVWHSGSWSRENGQGVMATMDSRTFRSLTGHIVYGGNIEPRGVHKLSILWGRFTKLKAYRETGNVAVAKATPVKRDRIAEIRQGRAQQLEGVRCRVRKNKA